MLLMYVWLCSYGVFFMLVFFSFLFWSWLVWRYSYFWIYFLISFFFYLFFSSRFAFFFFYSYCLTVLVAFGDFLTVKQRQGIILWLLFFFCVCFFSAASGVSGRVIVGFYTVLVYSVSTSVTRCVWGPGGYGFVCCQFCHGRYFLHLQNFSLNNEY